MARAGWHILEGDAFVVARRLPPRFDVVSETSFPDVPRRRLAMQIRQDVWRALRGVRGFSPVIEIRHVEEALRIRAGGRIEQGPVARDRLQSRIATVLSDPARRTRWKRFAERGRGEGRP